MQMASSSERADRAQILGEALGKDGRVGRGFAHAVSELEFSAEEAAIIGIFGLLLLLISLVPNAESQSASGSSLFLYVVATLPVAFVLRLLSAKEERQKTADLFLILGLLLLVWEIFLGKLDLLDPFLFPSPERVFAVFGVDYKIMLEGMVSSFAILLSGYLLGLAVAIPLALVIG